MSPIHLLLLARAYGADIDIAWGPDQGTAIDGGEAWYLAAESSVQISADVSGLDANGVYFAVANGVSTEVGCGASMPADIHAGWYTLGTDGNLSITTPIGPEAPDWYKPFVEGSCPAFGAVDAFPEDARHRWWLLDETRVLRPVSIEVVDAYTQELAAFERYLVYDARDGLETRETNDVSVQGLWAQLAPSALDALGAQWTSLLPEPSLASVQAVLDANLGSVSSRGYEGDELCFDLDAVSPFLGLSEYSAGSAPTDTFDALASLMAGDTLGLGVFEQALVAYAGYRLARQAADAATLIPFVGLAAGALVETACVKSLPSVDDFEVCVGSFDQELVGLTLGGVESAELAFSRQSGELYSDTVLADVDADVVASLGDVRIRYKRGTCAFRPSMEVDMADTSGDRDWLDEWGTCSDLGVEMDSLARATVAGDAARLAVGVYADAEGALYGEGETGSTFAAEDVVIDGGAQTCAEPWIAPHMEAALAGWETTVETQVALAWDSGLPDSGEVLALAPLLAPLDIGRLRPREYTLTAELDHLATSRAGGLEIGWSTNTEVLPDSGYGIERRWWVNPTVASRSFWENGLDPDGDPYDLAISMTTPHLNQILRSLANSDALYEVPIRPTNREIGYAASGVAPGDIAELTPDVLASLYPLLQDITPSSKVTQLYVSRQMAPFVHGTDALHFELGRLTVELREDELVGEDAGLWLRVEVDVWDPELDLDLHPTADRLVASFSPGARFDYTVAVNNVPDCEMYPSGSFQPSCSDFLLEAMIPVLEPYLEEIVLGLFSEIPLPLTWDADGGSPITLRAHQRNRFIRDGVITWTTTLSTPTAP